EASPVRIFSRGGGGSVDQSNSASSEANAGNEAKTRQRADQQAGGHKDCGCKGVPIQGIGQQAGTGQLGFAGSGAFQLYPGNVSDPLRIKSPDGKGKDGHDCRCKDGKDGKAGKDGKDGKDGKGSYPSPCRCSDGGQSYPGSGSDGQKSNPDLPSDGRTIGDGGWDGQASYPDPSDGRTIGDG